MVKEKKKTGVLVWIFLFLFAFLIFGFFILSHSRVQIAERKTLTEKQEAQLDKYINTTDDMNGTTEEVMTEAGLGVAIMIQDIGKTLPVILIMGAIIGIIVVIVTAIMPQIQRVL